MAGYKQMRASRLSAGAPGPAALLAGAALGFCGAGNAGGGPTGAAGGAPWITAGGGSSAGGGPPDCDISFIFTTLRKNKF